jgi:murein L,D-transpeptidase YafK
VPAIPCERILRIEVHKAGRVLFASCESGASLRFPIALGRDPVGPKERAGDSRTPEGSYRIAGAPRRGRFHLFIPIDYPSAADAERALRAGVIGRATYERIRASEAQGTLPPQDSALGGHLGLHGEGARWRGDSRYLDWTDGCIALTDADIEFIAERIEVGSPISILP